MRCDKNNFQGHTSGPVVFAGSPNVLLEKEGSLGDVGGSTVHPGRVPVWSPSIHGGHRELLASPSSCSGTKVTEPRFPLVWVHHKPMSFTAQMALQLRRLLPLEDVFFFSFELILFK